MDQAYRNTSSQMEKLGVNLDHIIRWQGGYLGHPKREEQRVSEAYDAGYNDGRERKTDGYTNWVQQ